MNLGPPDAERVVKKAVELRAACEDADATRELSGYERAPEVWAINYVGAYECRSILVGFININGLISEIKEVCDLLKAEDLDSFGGDMPC